MLITNTSSALRYPPFQSLSTNRVQRCVHRGRCGAQKQDSTPALGVGMAQILLSAPAWAEDLVNEAASKIQTTEVPSVPSAEEVIAIFQGAKKFYPEAGYLARMPAILEVRVAHASVHACRPFGEQSAIITSAARFMAWQVLEKAPAAGGSILDLFTDNPILLAGLGFLAAVPLIIGFFSGEHSFQLIHPQESIVQEHIVSRLEGRLKYNRPIVSE